jgi:carbonic anhydrase/acetyltransferase-like protein (isoleucine patch superfamily)
MALVLPFGIHRPRLGKGVFVAPNATLIGDVFLDDGASIWFGAVLRGDVGAIRIGKRSNIQDLACVHVTDGLSNTVVGDDVTVGHSAILHGCIVGDRCLIGMGAILLDNCEIGAGSVIAAGSVVTARTRIPPRSLVRGTPAKVIREVTEQEGLLGVLGAEHYVSDARRYLAICGDPDEALRARREDQDPDRARDRGEAREAAEAREDDARRSRALDLGSDRDANED